MKEAITISVDPKVKEEVVEIFEQNGQKMSSVLELYLKEIIKNANK